MATALSPFKLTDSFCLLHVFYLPIEQPLSLSFKGAKPIVQDPQHTGTLLSMIHVCNYCSCIKPKNLSNGKYRIPLDPNQSTITLEVLCVFLTLFDTHRFLCFELGSDFVHVLVSKGLLCKGMCFVFVPNARRYITDVVYC